jgi:hypothetical protein
MRGCKHINGGGPGNTAASSPPLICPYIEEIMALRLNVRWIRYLVVPWLSLLVAFGNRIQPEGIPCGMCGAQIITETDTSLSSSVYPVGVRPMFLVDIHHSQGCT